MEVGCVTRRLTLYSTVTDSSHNPAPRPTLQGIFDDVYTLPLSFSPPSSSLRRIGYQRLALLFIVFALGAVHSLEVSPTDSSSESYLSLAKRCLSKGDFMRNNTVAGVQALNIMGHFYLDMEKGRDGESAWPIWGLVMRIIQAVSARTSSRLVSAYKRWVFIEMVNGGICLLK